MKLVVLTAGRWWVYYFITLNFVMKRFNLRSISGRSSCGASAVRCDVVAVLERHAAGRAASVARAAQDLAAHRRAVRPAGQVRRSVGLCPGGGRAQSRVASRHVSRNKRRPLTFELLISSLFLSFSCIQQRGLIHEQKNEFAEAKTYFKNATSLSPFHMPSLQHLVIIKC